MPYSFTKIEEDKSKVIYFVFVFLVLMYFLTVLGIIYICKVFWWNGENVYSIFEFRSNLSHASFRFSEIFLWSLTLASLIGALHWFLTIQDLIPKILKTLQAESLKAGDTYHQMFQNIIDEVSIATGGRKIQGVVIPTMAMNAFALADFEGNSVIGATEGLLARLNRSQIEAVVGHEAAHIVSGDCLLTTVTTSIFALYESTLSGFDQLFSKENSSFARGRGGIALFFIYLFIRLTHFCSLLMNMFISRQREFRADAVAVRLTRNPLSLAEALYKISTRWRGGNLNGEHMEAIFILNPQYQFLDEINSTLSLLFATHPPVKDRIDILLDLAKLDFNSLEQTIQKAKPMVRQPVPQAMPQAPSQWIFYQNGNWQGPYLFDQLKTLTWITPETWIRRNDGDVVHAYQDIDIRNLMQGKINLEIGVLCPRCKISLSDVKYEGTSILKCLTCLGLLVEENDVMRIIIREEIGFSDQIIRSAHMIQNMQKSSIPLKINLKTVNFLDCPNCQDPKPKMLRQFYNLAYPIEVDKCFQCSRVWFDKDELEVLQFLIEENRNLKI